MEPTVTDQKVLAICQNLNTLPAKMTPKGFIINFMTSKNLNIASLRRFWAQPTGIDSTMEMVDHLRREIIKLHVGRAAWSSLILQEVNSFFIYLYFRHFC